MDPLEKKDDEVDLKAAAKAFSQLGASKGGKARARALTPDQRREIARKAAAGRWAKGVDGDEIPRATHASTDRPLIGDIAIACYVLADGRRVISLSGMLKALDMSLGSASGSGQDRLASFVGGKSLNPFIGSELSTRITNPIRFYTPSKLIGYGYEATVLADLCDAVLIARAQGELHRTQEHIAKRCEILVRGFARVGIIALVDEATGYQDDRAKDALAKILEAFIAKELRKWVKTFPAEFYKEMFRLKGWKFTGKTQRPRLLGHLTNDLVYARLAPGVLEELRAKNPVVGESGHRKHKHFQWLTSDLGHPKLLQHISALIALMRIAENWDDFVPLVDKALPKYKSMPLFDGLGEDQD
jgi:hypothetical protein